MYPTLLSDFEPESADSKIRQVTHDMNHAKLQEQQF